MEFFDTIKYRRSTRSYRDEQVCPEKLEKIIAAACTAPVGMAVYPNMHITVVQNADVLAGFKKDFCNFVGDEGVNIFYGAPTVIVVSEKSDDPADLSDMNAACVIENMILAATDLGLGTVFLKGFTRLTGAKPEYEKLLGVPEGYTVRAGMTLGVPGDDLTERPFEEKISVNYVK